jgi:DNA polymerase-3 subunit gamma/tau
VHEINAAVNTGIDNIRDMIEKIQLAPVNNICKVCIIDEVHMLTLNAFNALLKILEEPPKNVLFILATTDPKRIPSTVVSRCHKLYFLPLNRKDLAIAITHLIWTEKGNVTNKVISQILDSSEGSFRDALIMVDMLMIQDKNITQNTYSFLFNNVSYSISALFLKYSLSKDIKKILHMSRYLEKKIHFANVFTQEQVAQLFHPGPRSSCFARK